MYVTKMTPAQIDWMQLGWLGAWILHCEGDYHERKFEELPNVCTIIYTTSLFSDLDSSRVIYQ